MYAIIKTGGKQYKVQEGDVIKIELLNDVTDGDKHIFDEVLLVSNGDDINIGSPLIKSANVETTVIENGKGKKVIAYKYKSKKGYHKKRGHRQPYTKLKIEKINA